MTAKVRPRRSGVEAVRHVTARFAHAPHIRVNYPAGCRVIPTGNEVANMTGKGKGGKKTSGKAAQTLSAKDSKQVKGGVALNTVAIKQTDWKVVVGDGSVKLNTIRGG